MRNDVAAVGAGKGDALLLADCVTSLGGIPVEIDAWGVDIALQRHPEVPRRRPWPRARSPSATGPGNAASSSPQSWYLDLGLVGEYVGAGQPASARTTTPPRSRWSCRSTPGSAPFSTRVWRRPGHRHAECGRLLQDGLEGLGLQLFAEKGHRLPELTTVRVPDGVDAQAVRARLLERYGIEIGGGARRLRRQGVAHRLHGPHGAARATSPLLLAALAEVLAR